MHKEVHKLKEARRQGLAQLAQATGDAVLLWRAHLVYIERKLLWYRGRMLQERERWPSGWLTGREQARLNQEVVASRAAIYEIAPPVPMRPRRYRHPLDLQTLIAPPKKGLYPRK